MSISSKIQATDIKTFGLATKIENQPANPNYSLGIDNLDDLFYLRLCPETSASRSKIVVIIASNPNEPPTNSRAHCERPNCSNPTASKFTSESRSRYKNRREGKGIDITNFNNRLKLTTALKQAIEESSPSMRFATIVPDNHCRACEIIYDMDYYFSTLEIQSMQHSIIPNQQVKAGDNEKNKNKTNKKDKNTANIKSKSGENSHSKLENELRNESDLAITTFIINCDDFGYKEKETIANFMKKALYVSEVHSLQTKNYKHGSATSSIVDKNNNNNNKTGSHSLDADGRVHLFSSNKIGSKAKSGLSESKDYILESDFKAESEQKTIRIIPINFLLCISNITQLPRIPQYGIDTIILGDTIEQMSMYATFKLYQSFSPGISSLNEFTTFLNHVHKSNGDALIIHHFSHHSDSIGNLRLIENSSIREYTSRRVEIYSPNKLRYFLQSVFRNHSSEVYNNSNFVPHHQLGKKDNDKTSVSNHNYASDSYNLQHSQEEDSYCCYIPLDIVNIIISYDLVTNRLAYREIEHVMSCGKWKEKWNTLFEIAMRLGNTNKKTTLTVFA